MSCEHIQELLLADYHDGCLSAGKRHAVDAHLKDCKDCSLLSERIFNQTVKPFNQAVAQVPDDFCWTQIKRRIETQPVPVRRFVWVAHPAFAAVSLCMIIIVAGIVFRQSQINKTPYMSFVLASDTDNSDDVSRNIEDYFL